MIDIEKLKESVRSSYNDKGPNSWEHIQQVIKNGEHLAGRPLDDNEMAALLLHDMSVKPRNSKHKHGYWSAVMSRPILKHYGYDMDSIREITKAIREHDNHGHYSNQLGEFLQSADANPPDPRWIMNKSYTWWLKSGEPPERNYKHVYDFMHELIDGTCIDEEFTPLYRKVNKEQLKNVLNTFKSMSQEDVTKQLKEYRKRHRLKPYDIGLPIYNY